MSRILHVHVPKAEATVEIDIEQQVKAELKRILNAGLTAQTSEPAGATPAPAVEPPAAAV